MYGDCPKHSPPCVLATPKGQNRWGGGGIVAYAKGRPDITRPRHSQVMCVRVRACVRVWGGVLGSKLEGRDNPIKAKGHIRFVCPKLHTVLLV